MDSTVITIECIDEIADFCGKKQEVAAITEAAMRGEIKDYAESLRQRVVLLAGLSVTALEEVIRYRLKFTPGVKALVATARQHHVHTLLVSGGFTQFTGFVAEKIGYCGCPHQADNPRAGLPQPRRHDTAVHRYRRWRE
jgi:phosphoserine phosphatase